MATAQRNLYRRSNGSTCCCWWSITSSRLWSLAIVLRDLGVLYVSEQPCTGLLPFPKLFVCRLRSLAKESLAGSEGDRLWNIGRTKS